MPAAPAPAGPSVKKIADFEILAKLGEGGMGAVYKARQASMDRLVALKVLPPQAARDPKYKERFFREARVSAKLNHLNIMSGIDCGEADGFVYFAMEYIEGPTLRQIMKKRGAFEPYEAAQIMRQMADALIYAATRKLIHRDVKPDNIMLTAEGVAKLCDLGLAKQASTPQAGTESQPVSDGAAVGTPHYISPEQARGHVNLDARCDIYSLGCTFYHLLAGQTPFAGDSSMVIMAKHLAETAPSPCAIDRDIPHAYGQIISKMMAKEPDDRYADGEELAADLDVAMTGGVPEAASFRAKSSCAMPATKVGKTSGPLGAVRQTGRQVAVSTRGSVTQSGPVRTKRGRREAGMSPLVLGGISIAVIVIIAIVLLSGGRKEAPPQEPVKRPYVPSK
jgi:eukaryotic-like serine/threonine-protein kinase